MAAALAYASANPASCSGSGEEIFQIVNNFKTIRDIEPCENDNKEKWYAAYAIRKIAKKILHRLGQEDQDGQEPYLQSDDGNNVPESFDIRTCAKEMADPERKRFWKSACQQIISATRRAEEMLAPHLWLAVLPEDLVSNASRSVAFTHPTAPPDHQLSEVTWSETDTVPFAEALDHLLPSSDADPLAKKQALDFELTELQARGRAGPRHKKTIAGKQFQLAVLNQQAGDLKEATLLYEEFLNFVRQRQVIVDGFGPNIAMMLHQLAKLSQEAGDSEKAEHYYSESLQMSKDLNLSQEYYNKSLPTSRSLHGAMDTVRDTPEIAKTMGKLVKFLRF